MHPIWYANCGGRDKQNIRYHDLDELNGGGAVALRDIQPGEELLVNYGDIDSADEGGEEDEQYPEDEAWAKAKEDVDRYTQEFDEARKKAAEAQKNLQAAEAAMGDAARRVAKAQALAAKVAKAQALAAKAKPPTRTDDALQSV